MDSRCELITKLRETGFMMDDIRLYLDTHPNDVRAIKTYNEYARLYKKYEHEYTTGFAGIGTCNENNNDDIWMWNEYPMPWEGGCR